MKISRAFRVRDIRPKLFIRSQFDGTSPFTANQVARLITE